MGDTEPAAQPLAFSEGAGRRVVRACGCPNGSGTINLCRPLQGGEGGVGQRAGAETGVER